MLPVDLLIYSNQAEGRLENSPCFYDSPKDACGIQTKGLERECEARAIRTRQSTLWALRVFEL